MDDIEIIFIVFFACGLLMAIWIYYKVQQDIQKLFPRYLYQKKI